VRDGCKIHVGNRKGKEKKVRQSRRRNNRNRVNVSLGEVEPFSWPHPLVVQNICWLALNIRRYNQPKNLPKRMGQRQRLTTTSFGLAGVTRLSSQYSQPPLEAIKAVSKINETNHVISGPQKVTRKKHTVSTAQTAEMVRDSIQVITVRGNLQTGVFWRVPLHTLAVDARWEWRGHVIGQV
jgi:hypothetical protein